MDQSTSLVNLAPYFELYKHTQTPFNDITKKVDTKTQKTIIATVNIIYFLVKFVFFCLVCLFHRIVGRATIELIIITVSISWLVPLPSSPKI